MNKLQAFMLAGVMCHSSNPELFDGIATPVNPKEKEFTDEDIAKIQLAEQRREKKRLKRIRSNHE